MNGGGDGSVEWWGPACMSVNLSWTHPFKCADFKQGNDARNVILVDVSSNSPGQMINDAGCNCATCFFFVFLKAPMAKTHLFIQPYLYFQKEPRKPGLLMILPCKIIKIMI